MASSPIMTPGVLTGAGTGMGAMPGVPDLTGLGGLFGALMNNAGGVQTFGSGMVGVSLGGHDAPALPESMVAALSQAGFDASAFLATQSSVEQTVQLEDGAPAITIKGDAETVQAFVAQVRDIYQKVILEGKLTLKGAGNSDELAAALQHLGLDAQTAVGVAERIETMMKLLEQYHDKQAEMDSETAGTLVAMMLAVMGQNETAAGESEAANLSLQITTVEQTITVSSQNVIAWKSSGDITQDLLAMGASGGAKGHEAPVPRQVQAVEVRVSHEGEASTIAMVLPDAKPVATPARMADTTASDMAVDSKEVTLAARAPVTVQALKPSEVMDALEGETYYTLKANANGTETVDAVKPLPQGHNTTADALPDAAAKAFEPLAAKLDAASHGEWMQQQRADMAAAPSLPGHTAASGTGYAERYETIQAMLDKAHVGKQVAVQIQPLLEQGGGTIRLQLNPVELGKITVELSVENGKVHGAISASEHAVVEQLARELHTLRQGLADAGLKVSEQGINLMLSSNNSGGQFGQQSGQGSEQARANGRKSGRGVEGVESMDAASNLLASNLAAWVNPDRMLDVNV